MRRTCQGDNASLLSASLLPYVMLKFGIILLPQNSTTCHAPGSMTSSRRYMIGVCFKVMECFIVVVIVVHTKQHVSRTR